MDVFKYRASREVKTIGVFEIRGDLPGYLGGLFINFSVPRSLRWDVGPQRGELELEEWFKYFNEAGVKVLKFLILTQKSKLARLDGEIKFISP